MHAAALRLELRIPGARSLKEKRRRLAAISTQLTGTFPVVISEVDHQDQWQRATLGAALVSGQAGQLDRVISALHRLLLEHHDVELLELGVAYLEES